RGETLGVLRELERRRSRRTQRGRRFARAPRVITLFAELMLMLAAEVLEAAPVPEIRRTDDVPDFQVLDAPVLVSLDVRCGVRVFDGVHHRVDPSADVPRSLRIG